LRYFRTIDLNALLRRGLKGRRLGGDFGAVAMVRMTVALLIVGGRRLRHLGYVSGDPLFHRFCGVTQLPSSRTLSRWLNASTNPGWSVCA
jgi:hypothetical protein